MFFGFGLTLLLLTVMLLWSSIETRRIARITSQVDKRLQDTGDDALPRTRRSLLGSLASLHLCISAVKVHLSAPSETALNNGPGRPFYTLALR